MSKNKHLLGLELPTDPRWVDVVEKDIGFILSDHAYCEKKAAASCMSLIQNYYDHDKLIDELSPIVTEEWGHFRLVLSEIRKRGLTLGAPRKDEYVAELNKFKRGGGNPINRFMDHLLTFALIEARSCERFRVLSENLSDPYLKNFYHRFMVSEAGHYRTFLDLCIHYSDESSTMKRWAEYLEYEAEIMKTIPLRADRMH